MIELATDPMDPQIKQGQWNQRAWSMADICARGDRAQAIAQMNIIRHYALSEEDYKGFDRVICFALYNLFYWFWNRCNGY